MKIIRPSFTLAIWAMVAAIGWVPADAQSTVPGASAQTFVQALPATGSIAPVGPEVLPSQAGPQPPSAPPIAAPPNQGAQQAEVLLDQVRLTLDRFDSVSARERQQIGMFNNEILGTGLYFQQGHAEQRLTRMEIRSQTGDRATTLLEVCDGRYLWTYHGLPGGASINKLDLQKIDKAFADAAEARAAELRDFQVHQQLTQPESSLPGLAAISQAPNRMAVSGLPKLLDGLRDTFQFESVSQGRLGDLPVWVVEGAWKPAKIVLAAPDQKGNIEAGRPLELKKLPAQLPERVVIEVGQQDLFPYRIQYLRRGKAGEARGTTNSVGNSAGDTSANAAEAEQQTNQAGYRVIVSMELFDVHFNVQIDPRQFTFQPPAGAVVPDVTDNYLKGLNLSPAAK